MDERRVGEGGLKKAFSFRSQREQENVFLASSRLAVKLDQQ